MIYLVDTNVMWRRFITTDSLHLLVKASMDKLMLQGDFLCITPQNLIEFRAVATRPSSVNGLGMNALQASAEAKQFESFFQLLPDTPAIYPAWKTLVDSYGIIGKQVHDARLVAVMQTHGVTHLLTLNPNHFKHFANMTVVDPSSV